jgi:hypothetical protein
MCNSITTSACRPHWDRRAADDLGSLHGPHAHGDINPQSGSLPIWTERGCARRVRRIPARPIDAGAAAGLRHSRAPENGKSGHCAQCGSLDALVGTRTMSHSNKRPRRLVLSKCGRLIAGLGLVWLAALTGGCVRWSEQSDRDWKQYNPEWKSPTPPDPRPQWGWPAWP